MQEHNIPFLYEPTSYVLVEDFKFSNQCVEKIGKQLKFQNAVRKITYTPDFVGDNWIIETKGVRTESFNLKWKLFKKYVNENQLEYDLYAPSNKKEVDTVIEYILCK